MLGWVLKKSSSRRRPAAERRKSSPGGRSAKRFRCPPACGFFSARSDMRRACRRRRRSATLRTLGARAKRASYQVNRDQKAKVIEEIAGQITDSEAIYAADYRGLSVTQAAALRARLREADTTFRIVKNTLTLRAADKAKAEQVKELIDGPTA